MSDNCSSSSSGGIGFCGLLTVLFVGLKLTNYVAWSWWWILSPLWIPLAVIMGILVIAVISVFTFRLVQYLLDKRRAKIRANKNNKK